MALSLSVAVKAEILIKREMLMNRNCRKVLLHRGGHRVIHVAQLIHRDSDRTPCRCFGRNGIRDFGLANRFERVPIRRDFEKRISRDSYVAINPSQIVQLDDCLTGDKITLWVDDLPVYLSPD